MPRILRPTRAGWTFFLLTFGVGFAALNTGNNLLYLVLALMLSFLVLSGVLSEAALRGIRVRRRLPREIFAQSETPVALEIHNTQRRVASLAIGVEDRIEGLSGEAAAGRCFALRIGPEETVLRTYRLRVERRGPLHFHGFVVFTRFPFGLFSKLLLIDAQEQATAYPAISHVGRPERFGSPLEGAGSASAQAGDGCDVTGLRDHAQGDPSPRIHWRASLRARTLLVRELDNESERTVEVRLRTAGQHPGEHFEYGVRQAASEVVALLEAGHRVALRTDAELHAAQPGLRQRARLLAFLSRVEPGPAAELR